MLHDFTDVFGSPERRYYDFASASITRQLSERIAIIAIDDQGMANIGRWPWPRDVQAKLIDQLAATKAKTVVDTNLFFEPQTDRGMVYIRKIRDLLADPALGPNAASEPLGNINVQAETSLDTDALLAASMTEGANALVPSVFTTGVSQGRPDSPLPAYSLKSAVEELNGFSVPAIRGQEPIEVIGAVAAGIGDLDQLPDVDGAIRQDPLLINYFGKAVPPMSLLAIAKSLNLGAADIKLKVGESLQIGKLAIKTDEFALMLPQFYKGKDAKPAFAADSFYDVLSGKIPASKYTDKIVIVGGTVVGGGIF